MGSHPIRIPGTKAFLEWYSLLYKLNHGVTHLYDWTFEHTHFTKVVQPNILEVRLVWVLLLGEMGGVKYPLGEWRGDHVCFYQPY